MTRSPSVYLAIDNCFASKRWTRPADWMEAVGQLGVRCVEASADTEADPLYCGPDYMEDWVREVTALEKATGIKVVNLYSGHGTYSTLGLGHTEERVRKRMLEFWVKPMIRAAAGLNAGLGFYCHAFPDAVLQDPAAYGEKLQQLYDVLSEVAAYGASQGVQGLAVEQMYSPHQVPWTIEGTRDLLREVLKLSRSPLYITVDTGHQTGQRKFLRPESAAMEEWIRRAAGYPVNTDGLASRADPSGAARLSGPACLSSAPWVGTNRAQQRLEAAARQGRELSAEDLAFLTRDMDRHPYLFSGVRDTDPYAWLEAMGCFSPIIHLQQVTGSSSAHLPFTAETNRAGTIDAKRVLHALLRSYQRGPESDLPAPAPAIYLTLEIFSGTTETTREIFTKLRESVTYWRQYVPQDGLALERLVL